MRNSDIFNDYAKIAEEMGLVSLSEDEEKSKSDKPKETAKMRKYKKSPYPRMGSDDISTIEALYNVKPDNSIEYENNIMEAAHKTPVVIAPAYDRLNALVENNIERNNIMCNIALKPNNGNTTQHRYAEKDLLMQLVRVANDMDNSGNDELRSLADECIAKLTLKKNADFWDDVKEKGKEWLGVGEGATENTVIGGVVGAIIGSFFGFGGTLAGARLGAIAGGGLTTIIASLAKTAPHVVSISSNAKDTVSQIEDLKNKLTSSNKEYQFLAAFETVLKTLGSASEQYNELIAALSTNSNDIASANQAKRVSSTLMDTVNKTKEYTQKFNADVKLGIFNEVDQHSKILDPIYNMMNTDVEDIQQSLVSLLSAIDKFEKTLHGDVKPTATAVVQGDSTSQESPEDNTVLTDDAGKDNEDWGSTTRELGHEPSEEEKAFLRSLK